MEKQNRRAFLRTAVKSGIALGSAGSLIGSTGCRESVRTEAQDVVIRADYTRHDPQQTGTLNEISLTASQGEVEIAPDRFYRTWLYNGQYPGPEIRVKEGDRLRVSVENRLPEETTIHWHGIPVPNAMDGVPGLTQEPLPPGESFLYDFVAAPSGTYMYHSHVGLQIDRGLIAPLVIEEKQPHISHDREYSLVLDDFLPGEPQPLEGSQHAMGGRMGRGMMGRNRSGGRGMGGIMGGQIPPYEGLLINGRSADAPVEFETRRGDRVRFRLFNPSGATTFQFAVGGHRMLVTHADGQPVDPVPVDALHIGMGERYDIVVESNNPGVWPIMGATVEGDARPARAVFRYADASGSRLDDDAVPEGLRGGRFLELSNLRSLDLPTLGDPDRTFELVLSGGMMSPAWTINDQVFPEADLLEIHEGEVIRFDMVNRSMMIHPMHLHGHFFRTGNVMKDTVIVPPHMGRVRFDFIADNPGRWLFHCHNIYHLEAGMAREVRYI